MGIRIFLTNYYTSVKKAIAITFLGIILSVGIATTPLPPPPHKYFIRGYVQCDTLSDLSNYSIQMFAKHDNHMNEYRPVEGHAENFTGHSVDLTDTSGYFYIETTSFTYLDSVKVGVVFPDKEPIFSEAIYVDVNGRQAITDFFEENNGMESGCNGCSTNQTIERVVRYEYSLDQINVNLCVD